MSTLQITALRLVNQKLIAPAFTDPVEVVRWLGAVQSQDYAGAKWSLAQRMVAATDAAIEQALTDGKILRTHVLRPTWHFVTPTDIRWMLQLTAPRVHMLIASSNRANRLEDSVFKPAKRVIAKVLKGGKQLTRAELAAALDKGGITVKGIPLANLMMHAELEGLIVSGARRGKEFTYALLEERVPPAQSLTREEARAELTRRYFSSHGPATAADFKWWSGLTLTDAQAGIASIKSELLQETIDEKIYWRAANAPTAAVSSSQAFLLSIFDEYLVSYADHTIAFDPQYAHFMSGPQEPIRFFVLIVNGQVIGNLTRTVAKSKVSIAGKLFRPLKPTESRALQSAAQNYAHFLNLELEWSLISS